MMGISYGGISQLFTAQTDPPSLAAISPLSVIDDTQTTLYPGGILNTGFAVDWAKERVHDAKPAGPDGGQAWAYQRIQDGDQTCKDNQALHGEAANLLAKIRANDHYVPKVADPLAPITFVDKINVPVFMACQWTDEQTGGHCPTLAEHFTGTAAQVVHVHQRHPRRLARSRRPSTAGTTSSSSTSPNRRRSPTRRRSRPPAPVIYQEAMGIAGVTLPPDPIQQQPTYDGGAGRVRAAAADPRPVRQRRRRLVSPASRYPASSSRSRASRSRARSARSWYLAARRRARRQAARARAGADSFTWNAHARPLTDFTGDTAAGTDGLWTATPPYHWRRPPAGSAASYVTGPLSQQHDRDRRRRRARLGPLLDAERRPPGHDQRGPARRQGDLRAERLAAGQRAQARRARRARCSSPS